MLLSWASKVREEDRDEPILSGHWISIRVCTRGVWKEPVDKHVVDHGLQLVRELAAGSQEAGSARTVDWRHVSQLTCRASIEVLSKAVTRDRMADVPRAGRQGILDSSFAHIPLTCQKGLLECQADGLLNGIIPEKLISYLTS